MASEFSQISSDGSGYAQSPQDVLRHDLPLLKALERGPQDDPLVRREERSLSHEIASALHNIHQNQTAPMSNDDMINALAMSMLSPSERREATRDPYEGMLRGESEYSGGGDMSSIFGGDESYGRDEDRFNRRAYSGDQYVGNDDGDNSFSSNDTGTHSETHLNADNSSETFTSHGKSFTDTSTDGHGGTETTTSDGGAYSHTFLDGHGIHGQSDTETSTANSSTSTQYDHGNTTTVTHTGATATYSRAQNGHTETATQTGKLRTIDTDGHVKTYMTNQSLEDYLKQYPTI